MADIEKILDNLNIPKQILDKSEALLKALFGPSFDEIGGIIADSVKLRRFKNQIKILSKAQDILKEKKIDPKKVSLKVLAPLIEFSSYEEEEKLQDKWSRLTAHILSGNGDIIFQQNCITILNRLATEEAILLDKLHDILSERRVNKFEKEKLYYQGTLLGDEYIPSKPASPEGYALELFVFDIGTVSKDLKLPRQTLEFSVSNLVALGLLKWETDVHVSAEKSSEDPEDKDVDVSVDVYNNDVFIFTPLGDKFVKVCEHDHESIK